MLFDGPLNPELFGSSRHLPGCRDCLRVEGLGLLTFLMWSGFSWALGALDNAYALTHLRSQRPRFFADGWGDIKAAEAAQVEAFKREPVELPQMQWGEPKGNLLI